MYRLKNFLGAIFLLAALIIPQNVFAEKTDWKDSDFNFRNVRRVVLLDVDSDFPESNILEHKIYSVYLDNARKMKCEIMTEEQAA